MKSIFSIVLVSLACTGTAQALTLNCSTSTAQTLLANETSTRVACRPTASSAKRYKNNNIYYAQIDGYNLGLIYNQNNALEIECNLQSNPVGYYYGIRADVGAYIGVKVALFAGRNGVCFLKHNSGASYGVSLSAARLSIYR
ncbi:MAG: hypothetical protein ACOYOK_04405 [Pseudobdellovibrionaceae bacterium]